MSYQPTLDECRFFRENGFVILNRVLSPRRVKLLNERVTFVMSNTNATRRFTIPRDAYGNAFSRLMNVREHDHFVEEFVLDIDLAQIACSLLGVASVRVSHDSAFFKSPSSEETPLHADQYHWPVSSDRTVTAWIPLGDISLKHGPIVFCQRSHQLSDSVRDVLFDYGQRQLKTYLEDLGCELYTRPFKIGDVSFHLGWTFHGALANRTSQTRKAFTVVYMEEDIRLVQPKRPVELDVISRNWCPGCKVHDVLASPLNPVVSRRKGFE
jgi:ectoine hydroxylase-related dioxygenase (phytanoyl-CoA dioxygenase family)